MLFGTDIFYDVLYISIGLLIITLIFLIYTAIQYKLEKRRQPREGVILDKQQKHLEYTYPEDTTYYLTIAVIRDDVVLRYTFQVDSDVYKRYEIGDIYKEVI